MNAYDLHILFNDGNEEYVNKIHKHNVKDNVLHCYVYKQKDEMKVREYGDGVSISSIVYTPEVIASYPTNNIRKYTQK